MNEDPWRVIVALRAEGKEVQHETRREALEAFRDLVARNIAAAVWEWPATGGEMRCVASYPGLN